MKNRLTYKMRFNIYLIVYSTLVSMLVLLVTFTIIPRIEKPTNSTGISVFISSSSDEAISAIKSGVTYSPKEFTEKIITSDDLRGIYGKEFLHNLIFVVGIVFIVIMILSGFLVRFVSKRAIYPLERLTGILESISFEEDRGAMEEEVLVGELEGVKDIFKEHINKIETLMKEASTLNAYIAHEQKNSLALLRGKIQLGEYNDALPVIDTIVSNLDDILALNATTDLKEDEVVDLGLMAATAVDFYGRLHSTIEFDLDEENSLIIRGRESLIYRGVCNLIENAIKYGGGNIRVKVYSEKESVLISVEDEGPGINIEKLDEIFSYKYRGENLKKDGYGIGLSIVNHVTELCNGVVWAESEEGKGSKFYMVFKALTLD